MESPILEINFCGFKSTTAALQQHGWAISANQVHDYARAGQSIQLALKHECGLQLLSSTAVLPYESLINHIEMAAMLRDIDFDVLGVSLNGRSQFTRMPQRHEIDFRAHSSFTPIDAVPQMKEIDLGNLNFEDFCLFRPLNDSANIYVPETSVAELLSIIQDKQAPNQKEIREKRRKENLRNGFAEIDRSGNDFIKAQVIAI